VTTRRAAKRTVVAALVGVLLAAPAAETVATTQVATSVSVGNMAVGCVPSSAERPYVCDVGDPKPLSLESFNQIFQVDGAVRAAVARIGMPNYAEIQKVDVNDPWVNYELRTYYVEYNKMMVFSRAFILGNPNVSLLRHEGTIPADKLAMLTVGTVTTNGSASDAARRAEDAAALAESEAERAEGYAANSESAADGLDRSFRASLVKH
jgi:hypothetical protein